MVDVGFCVFRDGGEEGGEAGDGGFGGAFLFGRGVYGGEVADWGSGLEESEQLRGELRCHVGDNDMKGMKEDLKIIGNEVRKTSDRSLRESSRNTR